MKLHPLTVYRQAQQPPLSKADLAKRLGTSRTAITRWENGERQIARNLVREITEATGIPARELRPDLAELIE